MLSEARTKNFSRLSSASQDNISQLGIMPRTMLGDIQRHASMPAEALPLWKTSIYIKLGFPSVNADARRIQTVQNPLAHSFRQHPSVQRELVYCDGARRLLGHLRSTRFVAKYVRAMPYLPNDMRVAPSVGRIAEKENLVNALSSSRPDASIPVCPVPRNRDGRRRVS